MREMKKGKNIGWILLAAVIVFAIWVAWGNTALEINEYEIKSEHLPECFEGFRIAQISDLHNEQIGEDNEKLLDMLQKAAPDIIVITGDMIDSRRTDIEVATHFAEQAVKIAPCYYVTGNHEARLSEEAYSKFEKEMEENGVIVLHNAEVLIEREGEHISIAGMDDPSYASNHSGIRYSNLSNHIMELYSEDGYHVLLSHRPELFKNYVEAEVDLVLSGHAHGGQFRFPFIGGMIAPNQGFFPKYDAGLFTEDTTNMIVSRGIGNSLFPLRFNNRPEVVVVELRR